MCNLEPVTKHAESFTSIRRSLPLRRIPILPNTLPRAAMQRHRKTRIGSLYIVSPTRSLNTRRSIVRTGIIFENIECSHSLGIISPVDADVVLGPGYLDAAVALIKVVRWASLLRADTVVVGSDIGAGVGVVFAGREGGGDSESASAQCEEDE